MSAPNDWIFLLLNLLRLMRRGEECEFEDSIKNWPSIVHLLRGRCQRDRTFYGLGFFEMGVFYCVMNGMDVMFVRN